MRIRKLVWWNRFVALIALACALPAHAASITSYSLSSLLSNIPVDAGAQISDETRIFAQAINPAVPGFVVENGSSQWAYLSSDGSATSNVAANAIEITGEPALLGIPGEVGSFTIGAGNTIEDLITERSYYRPVIFLQIRDPSLNAGVSVVPVAPLMAWNTFKFQVQPAPGYESADLEGVTVDYFVAEEGWHRLVDDRVLLISSTELKDTDFTGKSFELGASFTDATTIVQLQRPALKRVSEGNFNGIDVGSQYMGATLVSGTGSFSSLTLRLMQDADTESAASGKILAGRVGFMVLGNVTSMDRGFQMEIIPISVRHGDPVRADLSYFHNRYHSAATSPLLNKSGCGADDDVQDNCVFMTPPVDTFSRGLFNTPRLPYVDADFEPLQMVRSFRMDKEDTEWGMDAHPHFDYWRGEVANALLSPDNHFTGGKIEGALARMHANIHVARGWDDDFLTSDWWLWLTVNHYDTCLFDGTSTACMDFPVTDDTILGGDNLAWEVGHWNTDEDQYDWGSGDLNTWFHVYFLENTSVSQKIFGDADWSKVDEHTWQQRIQPPAWAADRLAKYLNYNLPDEPEWSPLRGDNEWLFNFAASEPDTSNWEPWLIHSSTVAYTGTEKYDGAANTYKSGHQPWFVYPYRTAKGYTKIVSPKAAPLTGLLRPDDYLFANVPWGVEATNYRWVRSGDASGSNPTVVASNVFGYRATFADQGQWLAFCMTQGENCSDWHKVSVAPVATDVTIQSLQPVPVSETLLAGLHSFHDPDGGQNVSTHQWQSRTHNGSWVDIAGATENTFDGVMAAGTDIRYCVTPATLYVTGETVCSTHLTYDSDLDGDGIANSQDWDDDGDGYGDQYDAFPYDDSEWLDTDGDGIGNNADDDDDNDGLSDTEEENLGVDGFITDPLNNNTDGDGFLDGEDPSPTDELNRDWADTDGDLIHDDEDDDIDGDGVDNAADEAPFVACTSTAITVTSNADSGAGTLREAMANLCANDQFSDLNVIDFAGPMTITLASPLRVTKGMKIDGARQVTIDGNDTTELFRVVMPEHLPGTQFLHLSGLTLTGGYSNGNLLDSSVIGQVGVGTVVNTINGRWTLIEFSLMIDNQGPALGSADGSYTLENSLIARTYGDYPAIDTENGRVQVFTSTLVDHESGTVRVTGEGSADLYNSLLLNGPTGTVVCNVSTWSRRENSWVDDSDCGVTSDGGVLLADPDNNDFRPIPGSANIEAGPRDIDLDSVDFDLLGNERIMGEYNPDNPVEEGGPIYPYIDIGAIEYDYYGDFDGDGTNDTEDAFPNDASESADTDGDGVGDNQDALPDDANETLDTDGDGIGNNADTDDDNDGYSDSVEINEGSDPLSASSTPLDTDGDFIPDSSDDDDDNDGVSDGNDAFPLDASETTDTDNDGIGNNADRDDDNDGYRDTVEIREGSNPLLASDTPLDTDGDFIPNRSDSDDDNDGVTDSADAFPLDKSEWLDTDGDGTGDNADSDDDGDGIDDSNDAFPLDATESLDSDGDGIGDSADTDDDNDGYADSVEIIEGSDPLSASNTPLDTDGDFEPDSTDTDDDNDSVPDTRDAFPLDRTEWSDSDGDGVGDNSDPDRDGDGINDDQEPNVAPVISLSVKQNGRDVTTVYADQGQFEVVATVVDENPADKHSFQWVQFVGNDSTLTLDPAQLSTGLQRLTVVVTDDGEGNLSSRASVRIRVRPQSPVLSDADDSDNDGMSDSEEGLGDADRDRIPDYLDAVNEVNEMPADSGNQIMQTEAGLQLLLGDITFAAGNPSAQVSLEDIAEYLGTDVSELNDPAFELNGAIVDFIVTNLDAGTSVRVVIPQQTAIPANASYRKYITGMGWQAFIEDVHNQVASAHGEAGVCPAAGDAAYQAGLTEGHDCVQITIQDGGPNDADGIANGEVHDPSVVARSLPAPTVSASLNQIGDGAFNQNDGERVVLSFKLVSDSDDAQVSQLRIQASGDLDETNDVGSVKLYLDSNQDGVADSDELIGEGQFSADNGDISFVLGQAAQLAAGETQFLVTYEF